MELKDALAVFPPAGQLEMLTPATYEKQREAAQVVADALRRMAKEQVELLKAILVMRANTTVGQVSGYSLIRNEDLNAVADRAAALLLRPGSIPRLPPASPLEP